MIRNTSFTQQTHFIGVPVPGDLSRMLLSCREYMGSIYGCRSGFTTPFHITLVPPFRLAPDFSDDDVKAAAEEASASCRASHITPFACIVNGFGSFSDRTLFAHVEPSSRWTQFRDEVYRALDAHCPGTARRDTRPFTPHLTVANRDIPAGAVPEALAHFSQTELAADFPAETITVFKRENGRWIELYSTGGRIES
jgi:2'-5' RNA ligase